MRTIHLLCVAIATFCTVLAGCGKLPSPLASTWHQKFGWKAEDYFDDKQVIALCKAIEADDVKEMDRLITEGANVNAKGKGNMTPLLWAYPDNKLERFTKLLERGADPNVVVENDFNTHGGIKSGDSVTYMACKTEFDGYFEAVFKRGGDPNLINSGKARFHNSPLHVVIQYGGLKRRERVASLTKLGADLNYVNGMGMTPAITAVTWAGRYDIALDLLRAGANPKIYQPKSNSGLIHAVATDEVNRKKDWTPEQASDFRELVDWLAERGELLEDARIDLKRWHSWSATTGEFQRNLEAEIAERKAKESGGQTSDEK